MKQYNQADDESYKTNQDTDILYYSNFYEGTR
jgi:hypothetical protein